MIKFKNILLSACAVFVMLVTFCLIGCTENFSFEANFKDAQLVVEVGDEFDVAEKFDDVKVVFSSENEKIVKKVNDAKFRAVKSGRTQILAKNKNLLLDVLDVYVKFTYLTPANFKISNDGLLSWGDCGVYIDGKLSQPSYTIKLENNGEIVSLKSDVAKYQLTRPGAYKVTVQANASKEASASAESDEFSFNFSLTEGATNVTFTPSSEYGSRNGAFSWGQGGEGKINILGFEQNIISGESQIDFSNISEGGSLISKLVLSSQQGESITATKELQLLKTPDMFLQAYELAWNEESRAKEYMLSVQSTSEPAKFFKLNKTNSILEGLEEGIYRVGLQAMAGEGGVNGIAKDFGYVGKISNVNYTYSASDSTLSVTFSTKSEYNKKFVVSLNGKQYTYEFDSPKKDGEYSRTIDFNLSQFENTFSVQALPTIESDFSDGVTSTNNVVKSDASEELKVYNIAKITNLKHSTQNEESILSFTAHQKAENFSVAINGKKVADAVISREGDEVSINIGKITREKYGLPNSDEFEIIVTANAQAGENELISASYTSKTLTMLKAPIVNQLNEGKLDSGVYTWEAVKNAKYEYTLFSTNHIYEKPETGKISQSEEPKTSDIGAGYYIIHIRSLPIDENTHLSSEEVSADKFYVAKSMESAPLRLDYDAKESDSEKSGYVLKIKAVEHGYKYDIMLDSVKVGSIENSENLDSLTFKFDANTTFSEPNKENKITVSVSAKGDDQKIYLVSSSSLTVIRMKAPTEKEVKENSTLLEVKNTDEGASLSLKKDGEILTTSQAGQNASISIDGYDGEFEIKAYLNSYDKFDGFTISGTTMLQSEETTFKFHRSATPTSLNYSNNILSFIHTDKFDNYELTITAQSINGTASVKTSVDSVSVNLQQIIEDLRKNDTNFDSVLSQRTQIKVRLRAIISKDEGGVYYLPSRYATTEYDPSIGELIITKLGRVELEYDEEKNLLYWQPLEGENVKNVKYDVYLGEEKQTSISEIPASGRFEFSLNGYNFLEPGDYNFYVVATSDNTLASESSKFVTFHKISPVDSLRIHSVDGVYRASFELSNSEKNNISGITVNGENIGTDPNFEIKGDSLEIVVKGSSFVDNGNKVIYISSSPRIFTMRPINADGFDANNNLSEGKLSWADYASEKVNDISLATPTNIVRYKVDILNSDAQIIRTISNIDNTEIKLNNETFNMLTSGEYSYTISAYISEYQINFDGKGYYGSAVIAQNQQIFKLNQVSSLTATVDQSEGTIEQELAKPVRLTWTYDNIGVGEVEFEVYINNSLYTTLGADTRSIELDSTLLEKPENVISVRVISNKDIPSDLVPINVYRFGELKINVSDQAELTITSALEPPATEGFIVELTLQENNVITFVTTNLETDLSTYINSANAIGKYSIRVIYKATSLVALPCKTIATVDGTILSAPTYKQDEAGITFSSVDEGVKYVVKCPAMEFEQVLTDNRFLYPDNFKKGEYQFEFYTQKAGYIDSSKLNETITLDRLDNITRVTATRSENYLDFIFSWDSIAGAKAYQLNVRDSADELVLSAGKLPTNSVSLNSLKSINNLPSGDYTFSVFAIANYEESQKVNSQIYSFDVKVIPSTVSDIKATEKGLLSWSATENADAKGLYIAAKNAKAEVVGSGVQDTSIREYLVKNSETVSLTGRLDISIIQLASLATTQSSANVILLDGVTETGALYKNLDIKKAELNLESGNILLQVEQESVSKHDFYAWTYIGDKKVEVKLEPATLDKLNYEQLMIEICSLFEGLNEGLVTLHIYSVSPNRLRSEEVEVKFNYLNHNNSSYADKGGELDDYMIMSTSQSKNLTKVHLRYMSNGEWKYVDVDIDSITGYWVTEKYTDEDGIERTRKYFSLNEVSGDKVENLACYGINMAKALNNAASGNIEVQLGYITNAEIAVEGGTSNIFTVNNFSQTIIYTKLDKPTNFKVDKGNLIWNDASTLNSGYILYFEGDKNISAKVSSASGNYYLGENIDMTGKFYAGIESISTELKVLPSQRTYIMKNYEKAEVEKLAPVTSTMSLKNGVMQLEFASQKEGESYPKESIEWLIENKDSAIAVNADKWAGAFLSDIQKYPFRYSVQDLSKIKFTLKFVNNQTKREYLTTANAQHLLSRLDKKWLDILKPLLDHSAITSNKNAFKKAYEMLTNPSLFGGVASTTLLFDEIGIDEKGHYNLYPANNIPAGKYDIYIQQQGAADELTLNSKFELKLQNKEVVASPITRVDAQLNADNITQTYSIKFKPVEDKNGELYTSYTLVMSDKFDASHRYHYQIVGNKNQDGYSWSRQKYVNGELSSNQSVELSVDKEGFIYITLSDEQGLFFEGHKYKKDGKVEVDGLLGFAFNANIFVNGDENGERFNSKTENIEISFMDFNIDTLSIKNGKITWLPFNIENIGTYNTRILSRKRGESVVSSTDIPGAGLSTYVNFSPKRDGAYDYIKFFTPGEAKDFSIKVDSPIYSFNNLFKLKAPSITAHNGKLRIIDSNKTTENSNPNERSFVLSNSATNKKLTITTQNKIGNFYGFDRQTGTSKLRPDKGGTMAGDAEYSYALSERNASRFSAQVSGDDYTEEQIDCNRLENALNEYNIIVYNEDGEQVNGNIYLASETSSLEAKKLEMLSGANASVIGGGADKVKVENGDIVWEECKQGVGGISIPSDLTVVYEVEVNFLIKTAAGYEIRDEYTKKYYTTNASLSASYIPDPFNDDIEFQYIVFVRAGVFTKSASGETFNIETLEGERFSYVNAVYSGNTYILDSELVWRGKLHNDASEKALERTKAAENLSIEKGYIAWTYGEANVTYKLIATGKDSVRKELIGKVEKGQTDDTGKQKCYFKFDETKQQIEPMSKYSFDLYVVEKGKLSSMPTILSSGYMLPTFEENDYVADEDPSLKEGDHSLNFNGYFNKLSSNVSANTQLQVSLTGGGKTAKITVEASTGNISLNDRAAEICELINNGTAILVTVQPMPKVNTELALLSSYKATEFSLASTEFSDDDVLYFDKTGGRYYWTFGAKNVFTAKTDATLYDNEGRIFGLLQGDATVYKNLVERIDRLPIKADFTSEEGEEYPILYVNFNQVSLTNVDGKAMVTINSERCFAYSDETSMPIVTQLTKGDSYPLGRDYWTINVETENINGEKNVEQRYLPANTFKHNEQGTGLITCIDTPYYFDKECTKANNILPENSTTRNYEFSIIAKFNSQSQFTQIMYKGLYVYVKTADLKHTLMQNPNHLENIENVIFKVTIVTKFSEKVTDGTQNTTSTRLYDNIPLGKTYKGLVGTIETEKEGVYLTAFEPQIVGEITKFSVQARINENNLLSKPKQDTTPHKFNLFASGGSTATANGQYYISPYTIETGEQLKNAIHRSQKPEYMSTFIEKTRITRVNDKGQQSLIDDGKTPRIITDKEKSYSFKQTKDLVGSQRIEVDGFWVNGTFSGNYDGDGKQIEVVVNSLTEIDPITARLAEGNSHSNKTFSLGAALFKEVGEGSSIKNVNLNLDFEIDAAIKNQILTDQGALVGTLVLTNKGTIENVTLSTSSVTFSSALNSASTLVIGGIIGQNLYQAISLVSNANVNIVSKFSAEGQKFMYGGLVGFNNSINANMLLCENKGDISVDLTNNNNGVVMAAGLAITSEGSKLSLCINRGNITSKSSNDNVFAGGINVLTYNTGLKDCINMGNITSSNKSHAGGISSYMLSSSVYTCVAMGRVNGGYSSLFAGTGSVVNSSNKCYSYGGYGDSLIKDIELITASKTITCSTYGYEIRVTFNNVNDYNVEIIKK